MIGKILGNRYEILEEIGSGGMAIVYKAKCKMLNRIVAVKVLKPEFISDDTIVGKFNRESQAAASLAHPNIVSIFDVGREDDHYYIVMELVEGQNLKDFIRENPKMDWRQALKYSMQICSAIAHAHRNGIIHRDIKPHNILISKDGNCKVVDFGIASMSKNSETQRLNEGIMGSVHYISPEVAKGKIGDEKSDIYSLGVTMYELLTGVVPFDNENPVSIALMHINQTPKAIKDINIAVPLVLVQIVNKAMHKDSTLRYQTAGDLYKDLYAISNEAEYFVVKSEDDKEDGKRHTIKLDTEQIKNEMEKEKVQGTNEPVDDGGDVTTKDSDVEENATDTVEDKEEVVVTRRKKKKKGFFDGLFEVKNKKDKIAIIAAVVVSMIMIGTVIGIAVGVLFPGGMSGADDEFLIPDLVGRNITEVMEEFSESELKITVISEVNDKYAPGTIIHQNVKDKKVKLPYEIKVTVAQEERIIKLISYINKEARQVELEVSELGLQYVEKTEFNDEIPVGYVISQNPLPGEEVEVGDKITFVVSKGVDDELVEVPNLVGLTEAQAKARLTDYEFVLGGIIRKPSNEPEGVVIEQSAPAGSELVKKSKITLTLSNGKKQTTEEKTTNDEGKEGNSDSDTNKPDTSSSNDNGTSVTVKKYNLALTLPEGKSEVTVKVVQDGETVYNKKVSTDMKTLNITLEGNGSHSIVVYYDDMLVKTQKIKI